MREMPSTCDESSKALCDMDLSPGTATSPLKNVALLERSGCGSAWCCGSGALELLLLELLLLLLLLLLFIRGC